MQFEVKITYHDGHGGIEWNDESARRMTRKEWWMDRWAVFKTPLVFLMIFGVKNYPINIMGTLIITELGIPFSTNHHSLGFSDTFRLLYSSLYILFIIYIYVYVYIYIYIAYTYKSQWFCHNYIPVHVCIYTYTYVIYIYIYTRIYIYTYVYTYIYTYV